MEMPKVTEEHEKLHVFAGEWEGEEMMKPGPMGPGGLARGEMKVRVAIDGFFVLSDYVQRKDGAPGYGHRGLIFAALCLASLLGQSSRANAMTDADLGDRLRSRFAGDRTGVCVVAAVITERQVARARYCARARGDRDGDIPGFSTVFEIGSITKTMTALLVADLVEHQHWSLEDPIAKHLPAGTTLPRQGERQIEVRDLLTHTSGLPPLPSRLKAADASDPYATLSERDLLRSLGEVRLTRAIGSQVEYSNFGMMVLSLAVARSFSDDLEAAFKKRLFEPLGMKGAFIAAPPAGTVTAKGHTQAGLITAPWTMATNLAGVGMVHAHLDDMVRYAQAQTGAVETPLAARMRATQLSLGHGWGMAWRRVAINGHNLVIHGGGTGGFSSLVALEPDHKRAVVVLTDTALTDLGGLDDVGLPLLDIGVPMGKPRLAQPIPPALLRAMVGDFDLAGMKVRLWAEGGRLMGQAEGQVAMELAYDDHGDFYPTVTNALLTPVRKEGQVNTFAWRQGGGVTEGVRRGSRTAPTIVNPLWRDWAGEYQVAPSFSLRVFEEGGQLKIQGTAQPSIAAEVTGPDRVEVKSVGAVVEFTRNSKGEVVGATLRQGGQVLSGKRN
ncbi:MAG: serine hydrolase [Myxococcales bacterium]